MVDAAFLLTMTGLLVLQLRRVRQGWLPAARAVLVISVSGVLLAFLMVDRFATLRLLDYLVFLVLPASLGALGWKCLEPGRLRLGVSGLAPAALILVGVWSHGIEPFWLEVETFTLQSPKVTRPLRIAVVADLQTDRVGGYERRVIRRVVAEQADLILLTGDYLQAPAKELPRLTEALRELLRDEGFAAPLGAFAVRGDIDPARWASPFHGLPVTPFEATTTLELEDLTLSALSVFESRHGPRRLPISDRFHIVFGHAPDFALYGPTADLLIAGHTHGGQVQIPLWGPPLTFSRVPRSWASGVTDLGDGRTLVVSRGIGMERGEAPRIRFLCRPQIVIIEVLPTSRAVDEPGDADDTSGSLGILR